jgi:hypothetical protein
MGDLAGVLKQADPVFALTHGLDNQSRNRKINPRRYGERTWFEHACHKFAMFNKQEIAAIADYLKFRRQSHDISDHEKACINEALENYWNERAA